MDTTYCILKGENRTSQRNTLFRYGDFVYQSNEIEIGCCDIDKCDISNVISSLQRQQNKMAFKWTYGDMPLDCEFKNAFNKLDDVASFLVDQLSIFEEFEEEISKIDEKDLVFRLLCKEAGLDEVEMFVTKKYCGEVILNIIYFDNMFYATLESAESEQPLLLSQFPKLECLSHRLDMRTFTHPVYREMQLMESLERQPDEVEKPLAVVGSYNQTYIMLKSDTVGTIAENKRKVLFRFGNWCYSGDVSLESSGIDTPSLENIPELMVELHKQQPNLAFLCEFKDMTPSNIFYRSLQRVLESMAFSETEFTSDTVLEKLADVESSLSESACFFFELALREIGCLKNVEMVACKTYVRGVTLVAIYHNGSFHVVVADAEGDQPLLDCAFPQVAKRCKPIILNEFSHDNFKRLILWQVGEAKSEEVIIEEVSKEDIKEQPASPKKEEFEMYKARAPHHLRDSLASSPVSKKSTSSSSEKLPWDAKGKPLQYKKLF
eukprot:TRINITY_DN3594_c0_g1_i1.p1 TRINITY_DN3594_c0_g1~~TRINITY_DN3594_c0_g1_i1.p1  ORF type:complete len:492 (+),score=142.12 TRINITY_DN3594_c0_g1_i1:91-1566(+)